MSTVAVNRDLHKKLESRALDRGQQVSLNEPDAGVDVEIEVLPTEDRHDADAKVPATPRDPWLVRIYLGYCALLCYQQTL